MDNPSFDVPPQRPKRKLKASRNNENNIVASSVPPKKDPVALSRVTSPWDSDTSDNCISSESLEDEIFKELERASYDENQLNEAIKNFDKILNYYNEKEERQINGQPAVETVKQAKEIVNTNSPPPNAGLLSKSFLRLPTSNINTEDTNSKLAKGKSKIPLSRQVLTKSKTCSIIESKCILKKSLSHDGDLSSCVQMPIAQQSTPSFDKYKVLDNVLMKPNSENPKPQRNWLVERQIIKTSLNVRSAGKLTTPPHTNNVVPKREPLARTKSEWDIYSSRIPVKHVSKPPSLIKKNIRMTVSVNLTGNDQSRSPPVIHYAKVVSPSNPKMESCKVFPAIPFSGTKKDAPIPVPIKDASAKVCRSLQKSMPDQEYQSDNSDDSGHISNEHDESAVINTEPSSPCDSEKLLGKLEPSPGKISGDLLKYFDSAREDFTKKLLCNNKSNSSEDNKKEVSTRNSPIGTISTIIDNLIIYVYDFVVIKIAGILPLWHFKSTGG